MRKYILSALFLLFLVLVYYLTLKKKSVIMQLSDKGKLKLKELEGYREQPYIDIAGVKTVGWGHTGKDVPAVSSDVQNVKFFNSDVRKFEAVVNNALKVNVTQQLFDSLVMHAYNTGSASSTLYRMINSKSTPLNDISQWWVSHYVTAQGSAKKVLFSRRLAEVKHFNPDFNTKT